MATPGCTATPGYSATPRCQKSALYFGSELLDLETIRQHFFVAGMDLLKSFAAASLEILMSLRRRSVRLMGITTMQRSICWLLTWQKSVLALKRRKQKNENTRRAPPEGPRGPVDDRDRSNALPDLLGRYGICLLGHGVMKWRTSNIQTSPLPCGRDIQNM
nr:MAG TPA: hypothetical protein [Caudoviricetes sp.]